MTQRFSQHVTEERQPPVESIQRTLIITRGPLAQRVADHLALALAGQGALANAVAFLNTQRGDGDLSAAAREKLTAISRAQVRAELAENGFVLDRLQELALFLVVDLSDEGAASAATAAETVQRVAALAQAGWGLDTRGMIIALADDWSADVPRAALQAVLEFAPGAVDAIIPLSRVNELGLELDGPDAYVAAVGSVLAALIATPLRDAPFWAGDRPGSELRPQLLTSIGLSEWTWEPEPVRACLIHTWVHRILDRWLSDAPSESALVTQHAANWFNARQLPPLMMLAQLDRSVSSWHTPGWHAPYPWRVREAVARLQVFAALLVDAPAGATDLVLSEWEMWPELQEEALRAEMAALLDREPAGGIDRALGFLRVLSTMVREARDAMNDLQDQLAERADQMAGEEQRLLAQIETVVGAWPDGLDGWSGVALRPWRWPRLAWEYGTAHALARTLAQLLANHAQLEREQALPRVAAALYEQYETVVGRVTAHLLEVRDMLAAGSRSESEDAPPSLGALTQRLVAAADMEAAQAAAELGGLGQQVAALDEAVIAGLEALGQERFRFVSEMSAVAALAATLADEQRAADWWRARHDEATPLWLFDDARQPEESRAGEQALTVVCAADCEQLQTLLALPQGPAWRWVPGGDRRCIRIMRLQAGVSIQ